MQYNTHAPWRTTSTFQTSGYHYHFFIHIPILCLTTFWSILLTKPICSGCNSGIEFVVAFKYAFFQLCSIRLARFRRSSVKLLAVVLTSHTSYIAFLPDVRCAVQSGNVPFFCSYLSPMKVYLRNLFLLNTSLIRMLLT